MNSPDSYVSLALGFAVVLVVGMIAFNYFKAKTQPAAQTANETEQTAMTPGKYTVKAGETLWSIAETQYKNGHNWVDIQKANNLTSADRIEAGQELMLPEVKPMTSPTAAAVSPATTEKQQYTVVAGDSLWKIAVAKYNNGYRWSEIAQANKIANPDLIFVGTVLTLP